jgi:hypothetical protein
MRTTLAQKYRSWGLSNLTKDMALTPEKFLENLNEEEQNEPEDPPVPPAEWAAQQVGLLRMLG